MTNSNDYLSKEETKKAITKKFDIQEANELKGNGELNGGPVSEPVEQIDYTSEIPNERVKALVDNDVLLALLKHLHSGSARQAIDHFIGELKQMLSESNTKGNHSKRVDKFIEMLDTESALHKTIRAIQKGQPKTESK